MYRHKHAYIISHIAAWTQKLCGQEIASSASKPSSSHTKALREAMWTIGCNFCM